MYSSTLLARYIYTIKLNTIESYWNRYTYSYIANYMIFFVFFFFFFAPDDKYVRKQSSRAANTMKFGTLLALPKSYISIKFGTIPGNIDENMTDSR